MRAGWIGTIHDFLNSDCEAWIESLENHVQLSLGEKASQSNRTAWLNCHRVLKDQLGQFAMRRSDAPGWGIAFEYELPRERGRRVDVCILAGESVVLLEFKDLVDTLQAHVDQVAAYARDLSSYQAASHNRNVIPVLVKTLSDAEPVECSQVWITGASGLGRCIERTGVAGKPWASISDWIDSPYAPLPSLVRAARMIFKHEPLPRIKQAESAGVADAVAAVAAIIEEARSKSERHIVFVTGVPGAGTTRLPSNFRVVRK